MSNVNKAMRIIARHTGRSDPYLITASQTAEELQRVGLLAPDLRIINTVEELEALDPDTALTLYTWKEATIWEASYLQKRFEDDGNIPDLPAVVVATGDQVRAARKALEEEND